MLQFTRKDERTNLEKEIDSVIEHMNIWAPDSAEYTAITKNLGLLYEALDKTKNKRGLDINTILVVAGNLAGIVLILGYEKADVITTKALGFILKGRV